MLGVRCTCRVSQRSPSLFSFNWSTSLRLGNAFQLITGSCQHLHIGQMAQSTKVAKTKPRRLERSWRVSGEMGPTGDNLGLSTAVPRRKFQTVPDCLAPDDVPRPIKCLAVSPGTGATNEMSPLRSILSASSKATPWPLLPTFYWPIPVNLHPHEEHSNDWPI